MTHKHLVGTMVEEFRSLVKIRTTTTSAIHHRVEMETENQPFGLMMFEFVVI
jgi:hypothetical protein